MYKTLFDLSMFYQKSYDEIGSIYLVSKKEVDEMKKPLLLSLILTVLLVGCTLSETELTQMTIDDTKKAFEDSPKKDNEKTDVYSYYLPEDFSVSETKGFNSILNKGNQNYILFVNENEGSKSRVQFETLTDQYKKPFISQTFEDNERFGYLFVNKLGEKQYEVTVGIGGTKLTTETKTSNVAEDAKNMMEIVASVN